MHRPFAAVARVWGAAKRRVRPRIPAARQERWRLVSRIVCGPRPGRREILVVDRGGSHQATNRETER